MVGVWAPTVAAEDTFRKPNERGGVEAADGVVLEEPDARVEERR